MNKFLMAAAAAGALLVSVSPAAAQQYGRSGYGNGVAYGSNYGNRTGYADNGYARRGNDWDQDQNYRSHRRHDKNVTATATATTATSATVAIGTTTTARPNIVRFTGC